MKTKKKLIDNIFRFFTQADVDACWGINTPANIQTT